jgi:hypothetical protein
VDLIGAPVRLASGAVRAAGRRAEDAALGSLDALLASRFGSEAVDRILASELADRAIGKALEGRLVEIVARDMVRYAVLERVTDQLVADGAIDRSVEAALESPALERVVVQVLESRLLDEAVRRLIDGDELWILVDEIAQSPSVTDAIARQSVGFADQVAGGVRARSRRADAVLERAAKRALRRKG